MGKALPDLQSLYCIPEAVDSECMPPLSPLLDRCVPRLTAQKLVRIPDRVCHGFVQDLGVCINSVYSQFERLGKAESLPSKLAIVR